MGQKEFSMNNKGFSLIEMVMVIVLLSIIAGISAMILLEGIDGWMAAAPRKEALGEARMAMERMVREIREGRRYNYTPTPASLRFYQYTSPSGVPYRDTTYSWNSVTKIITRTDNLTATSNALASNITFCNFSVYAPNLIRIRLQSTVSGKTVELRDTAFFRNYTGKE